MRTPFQFLRIMRGNLHLFETSVNFGFPGKKSLLTHNIHGEGLEKGFLKNRWIVGEGGELNKFFREFFMDAKDEKSARG